MKICFLTVARSPYTPILLTKEAVSLRQAGHDVTIIAPLASGDSVDDPRARRLGLRIVPLGSTSESRWQKLLLLPRLLKLALREPCDVYQALEPQCLLVGGIANLIRRCSLIYDSREHYPLALAVNTGLGRRTTRFLYWVFYLFEAAMVRLLVDHVFAVDDGCVRRLQRFGKPVSQLTNYPRCDFGGSDDPASPRLGSECDTFNIVYTGFTRRRNAVSETIQAIRILRDRGINARATFTGLVDSALLNECQALMVELNLQQDAVSLLGYLQQDEIARLLADADCGSLLYYDTPYTAYTTHPVKLFEYMAFSLPVICSCLPSMSEMVQREDCGLVVDPREPEAIADAIARLIHQPELAARLGSNGYRAFLDRYNWEVIEPSYLAVYQRLSDMPARRRNTSIRRLVRTSETQSRSRVWLEERRS